MKGFDSRIFGAKKSGRFEKIPFSSLMSESFTVFTWFDGNSSVQKSNFYRWNRALMDNKEKFEILIFYDNEIPEKVLDKYPNLRFWRLAGDLREKPVALLNEAIRNSRKDLLVYVSPYVLSRKNDLYCLANRVRKDYSVAWASLKRCFLPREKGLKHFFKNILLKILWIFNSGRKEIYAHLNHPYDFFDGPMISFNKDYLNRIFQGLEESERVALFRADTKTSGALNFYFSHILNREGASVYNEGKLRSFQFDSFSPKLFFSWKNTFDLIGLLIREKDFHYPVNVYRMLLPVMQMTQVAFFILVWFSPVKSLSLIGFYLILGSKLFVELFDKRRGNSIFYFFFWFFSWMAA